MFERAGLVLQTPAAAMASQEQSAFSHPVLLKNRYVRNFLANFSDSKWDTVVKYACIYGIQCLSKDYDLSELTTRQMADAIRTNNASLTLHAEIPELMKQLESLQTNITDLGDSIEGGASKKSAAAATNAKKAGAPKSKPVARTAVAKSAKKSKSGKTSAGSGASRGKASSARASPDGANWYGSPWMGAYPPYMQYGVGPPSSGYYGMPAKQARRAPKKSSKAKGRARAGAKASGSKSDSEASKKSAKTPEVYGDYPAWWGSGALHNAKRHSGKDRANPRMAYSKPSGQDDKASEDLTKDDLATSKYVGVKSGGGYGQKASAEAESVSDKSVSVAEDDDGDFVGAPAGPFMQGMPGYFAPPPAYGMPPFNWYPPMPYMYMGGMPATAGWAQPDPSVGRVDKPAQRGAIAESAADGSTTAAKTKRAGAASGSALRAASRTPSASSTKTAGRRRRSQNQAPAERSAPRLAYSAPPGKRNSEASQAGTAQAASSARRTPKHLRGVTSRLKPDLDARKKEAAMRRRAAAQGYGADGTMDGRPPSRQSPKRPKPGATGGSAEPRGVLDIADEFLEGPVMGEFEGREDPWGALLQDIDPQAAPVADGDDGATGGAALDADDDDLSGVAVGGQRRKVTWEEAEDASSRPPTVGGADRVKRHQAWVGDYGAPQTRGVRPQASLSSDSEGDWAAGDGAEPVGMDEIQAEAERQATGAEGEIDDVTSDE